jgi:integrase
VPYVFTRQGQRIKSVREIWTHVCRDVWLTDVVFHDLRHTAVTKPPAGVDALTAMKIAGHKTTAAFKRYNTIGDDDLTAAQQQMDAYTGIKAAARHQRRSEVLEK